MGFFLVFVVYCAEAGFAYDDGVAGPSATSSRIFVTAEGYQKIRYALPNLTHGLRHQQC